MMRRRYKLTDLVDHLAASAQQVTRRASRDPQAVFGRADFRFPVLQPPISG
ncbi:hypothetical protein [Mesorhizobium sp. KR1-2]|uniref:hypothetical protein n=1 Tax=Mesorhizobium sp. KR1-2 TaxID=3156609 RepID=UPI0032B543E1